MAETVLVVEDDVVARGPIEAALSAKGWRVLVTDRIDGAWHLFVKERPDLCVVDVALPDGSGLDLCRRIRGHEERGATPVIVLTGRGELQSKSKGFEAGADQYLVKPVSTEELLLWAQALLRRVDLDQGQKMKLLTAGDLEINVDAHLVRYKGAVVGGLTAKEFDLFCYLVKNRPRVLSRERILKSLWREITVDQVVDTHLSNLRRKLPAPLADRIQTVPGKGFRFLD